MLATTILLVAVVAISVYIALLGHDIHRGLKSLSTHLKEIHMLEADAVTKLTAIATGLANVKTAVDALKATAAASTGTVPDDVAAGIDGVTSALQSLTDDLAAPSAAPGAAGGATVSDGTAAAVTAATTAVAS